MLQFAIQALTASGSSRKGRPAEDHYIAAKVAPVLQ